MNVKLISTNTNLTVRSIASRWLYKEIAYYKFIPIAKQRIIENINIIIIIKVIAFIFLTGFLLRYCKATVISEYPGSRWVFMASEQRDTESTLSKKVRLHL